MLLIFIEFLYNILDVKLNFQKKNIGCETLSNLKKS